MKTKTKQPTLSALKAHLKWVVRGSTARDQVKALAIGLIDRAPNKKVLRDRMLGTFPHVVTESNFLGF